MELYGLKLKLNYFLYAILALFCVVIFFVFETKENDKKRDEVRRYRSQLDYHLYGKVIAKKDLRHHSLGHLELLLDSSSSKLNINKEDSLQKYLRYNKELRFVLDYDDKNRIVIVVFNFWLFEIGDSVSVNTKENRMEIFRKGEFIRKISIIVYTPLVAPSSSYEPLSSPSSSYEQSGNEDVVR